MNIFKQAWNWYIGLIVKKSMGINKGLGWIKDLPDARDILWQIPGQVKIPQYLNLRDKLPKVYNQETSNSCTANAIAGAIQFNQDEQKLPLVMPSRLFIYYLTRSMSNAQGTDSGSSIRDGFKVINKQGFCTETLWPFNVSKVTTRPDDKCFAEAVKNIAMQYNRVEQSEEIIEACLSVGNPIVFGFITYESFNSPEVWKTGKATLPKKDENAKGGHAVLCVGFDRVKREFICRNSWGDKFGDKGYFYLPYGYVLNKGLAFDFWTVLLLRK